MPPCPRGICVTRDRGPASAALAGAGGADPWGHQVSPRLAAQSALRQDGHAQRHHPAERRSLARQRAGSSGEQGGRAAGRAGCGLSSSPPEPEAPGGNRRGLGSGRRAGRGGPAAARRAERGAGGSGHRGTNRVTAGRQQQAWATPARTARGPSRESGPAGSSLPSLGLTLGSAVLLLPPETGARGNRGWHSGPHGDCAPASASPPAPGRPRGRREGGKEKPTHGRRPSPRHALHCLPDARRPPAVPWTHCQPSPRPALPATTGLSRETSTSPPASRAPRPAPAHSAPGGRGAVTAHAPPWRPREF